MSNLIDEIRAAREELRRQEAETSEAGHTLSMCKERQRRARKELDKLLDELETGVSRYPLLGFDRLEIPSGNGIPVAVAPAASTVSITAPTDAPRTKRKAAAK